MAEHTHAGPAELGAPMDYAEHQRTYERFIGLTKITILGCIATLLALLLFGFGTGGFWLGVLMIILMMIGVALGIAFKGSIKPLVVVNVIGALLVIVSVA